jgi:hypothetical protein
VGTEDSTIAAYDIYKSSADQLAGINLPENTAVKSLIVFEETALARIAKKEDEKKKEKKSKKKDEVTTNLTLEIVIWSPNIKLSN